jgi:hypothetical protein
MHRRLETQKGAPMSLVPLAPRLRPRHTAGPIFMMPGSGASPASGFALRVQPL